MNTFNEGDRVSHPTYGEGTIDTLRDGTGWPTVQFDSGERVMTSDFMLTPVPETPASRFKVGDRVSHPLHRDGVIEDISEANGLHTVNIGGDRVYMALEHQIEPAKPEPKFSVLYHFTHGKVIKSSGMPMNRQQTEAYLANFPDWDTIESITITRAKGN